MKQCPMYRKYKKNAQRKSKGQDQLSAIIDTAMEDDLNYLFALTEKVPLMLLPCNVGNLFGITLCDDAATQSYISYEFARDAGLPVSRRVTGYVKLPNGQRMKKFGTVEFELHISEWHGVVTAHVLELCNEFDIVLGMDWHQKWEPIPHWKELEFHYYD